MEKSIGTHWGVDARVVYTVVWFALSKLQRPGISGIDFSSDVDRDILNPGPNRGPVHS